MAPVDRELTEFDLKVSGQLPPELDGVYVRNGPNPVTPPDPEKYHWFTGTGMVHGLRLGEGKAQWYRNRWVRSADVAKWTLNSTRLPSQTSTTHSPTRSQLTQSAIHYRVNST